MKKKITNTHKEPISLPILRPQGICKHPQRAYENLLVGESRVVDESEVAPEVEKMCKRYKVKIEDVVEEKPRPIPKAVDVACSAEHPCDVEGCATCKAVLLSEVEESEEDLNKLEQELLSEESTKPSDG